MTQNIEKLKTIYNEWLKIHNKPINLIKVNWNEFKEQPENYRGPAALIVWKIVGLVVKAQTLADIMRNTL